MARPKKSDKRVQLSVGVEEKLKAQLMEAAEAAERSLSGEVVFRLRSSFEQQQSDAAA
jgi:hypothetical protein